MVARCPGPCDRGLCCFRECRCLVAASSAGFEHESLNHTDRNVNSITPSAVSRAPRPGPGCSVLKRTLGRENNPAKKSDVVTELQDVGVRVTNAKIDSDAGENVANWLEGLVF